MATMGKKFAVLSAAVLMSAAVWAGASNGARYCVVDLSAGANASSYPVTYMDSEPSGGFNTTEYKTTKLVLKRVDKGSFTMGDKRLTQNVPHKVTIKNAFYMGLYEVTQKQWWLVMGTFDGYLGGCIGCGASEGEGDAYPMYWVSWDMIRGKNLGSKYPASTEVDADSFMGKLRARTGEAFDLPTEEQWEYTCRAGTKTYFSFGNDLSKAGDYMWYYKNSGYVGDRYGFAYAGSPHEVGTKKPNPWGFYDMHGNVSEVCNSTRADHCKPPYAKSTTSIPSEYYKDRVWRGGNWCMDLEYIYHPGEAPDAAYYCSSPTWHDEPSDVAGADKGFRLSLSSSGSSSSASDTTTIVDLGVFTKARTFKGYLVDGEQYVGTIQVKAAKAKVNRKTGATTSKFTAVVQVLGEKKVSLKGDYDLAEGAIEMETRDGHALSIAKGDADASFVGTFDEYDVEVTMDDGTKKSYALEEGAAFYMEGAELAELLGDDTYEEYLPDGIEITTKGTKWVLPKAGKVVYNRKTGEVDETKLGENPSGLKLTFKAKDGSFTGSFKAYTEVKGKPKATTVSVSGLVVDGIGYGIATIKKVGSVLITIE